MLIAQVSGNIDGYGVEERTAGIVMGNLRGWNRAGNGASVGRKYIEEGMQ